MTFHKNDTVTETIEAARFVARPAGFVISHRSGERIDAAGCLF
jgi:enolase